MLAAADMTDIFNDNATLSGGMTLAVSGITQLNAPLRLNGGTFAAGSLTDVANLDWDAGTVKLTNSGLDIESGGCLAMS